MASHSKIDPAKLALGLRIKQARNAKGLSQNALALRLSLTSNAVAQWETGRAEPQSGKMQSLARELDVTTEWLLTGNDEAEIRRAQTVPELKVLRMMRSLDPAEQERVIRMIEAYSKKD